MEHFTEEFLAFRERMEARLPEEFRKRERGLLIAGRGCALAASYALSQERKMFGLVGFGNHTHCHEERLLYSVPGLKAEQIPDWQAYARAVLAERIQMDGAHEFSIFSLILATDAADRRLTRALKRADVQENYTAPEAGWAQIRFLVADLSGKQLYASPMGKPLLNMFRDVV